MKVSINGQDRHIDASISLSTLLGELNLDPRAVVVELNRQIVRRPDLDQHTVSDGDQIELVHFVGGG